jgi:hypothetical protein
MLAFTQVAFVVGYPVALISVVTSGQRSGLAFACFAESAVLAYVTGTRGSVSLISLPLLLTDRV